MKVTASGPQQVARKRRPWRVQRPRRWPKLWGAYENHAGPSLASGPRMSRGSKKGICQQNASGRLLHALETSLSLARVRKLHPDKSEHTGSHMACLTHKFHRLKLGNPIFSTSTFAPNRQSYERCEPHAHFLSELAKQVGVLSSFLFATTKKVLPNGIKFRRSGSEYLVNLKTRKETQKRHHPSSRRTPRTQSRPSP